MCPRRDRLAAVLLVVGLAVLGCSRDQELGEASDDAARVEKVPGQEVSQVTLTRQAVGTLDLRTEPARAFAIGGRRTAGGAVVVPYSAVLYDASGGTWVYRVIRPRSYVRTSVELDRVVAGTAYVSAGLDAGTDVVTVGAPELLGAEEGVEGE